MSFSLFNPIYADEWVDDILLELGELFEAYEKYSNKESEKDVKTASDKTRDDAKDEDEWVEDDVTLSIIEDLMTKNGDQSLPSNFSYVLMPRINANLVEEVTLLDFTEWTFAQKAGVRNSGTWWLREASLSKGMLLDSNPVLCVDPDGKVRLVGYDSSCVIGVRPAFVFDTSGLNCGDKVMVENTVCTVVGENLALSDTIIEKHIFDEKTNDFDKSEIKKYINSDEFKSKL